MTSRPPWPAAFCWLQKAEKRPRNGTGAHSLGEGLDYGQMSWVGLAQICWIARNGLD